MIFRNRKAANWGIIKLAQNIAVASQICACSTPLHTDAFTIAFCTFCKKI